MTRQQVWNAYKSQILSIVWSLAKKVFMALPLTIIAEVIAYGCIIGIEKKKNLYVEKSKKSSIIILAGYAMMMFQLVIISRPLGSIYKIDLIPFDEPGGGHLIFLYALANVLVFVPLGVLVPSIWKNMCSLRKIVLLGFAISAVIEILQLALACGMCQTEDLIMNTIGAGIGFGIKKRKIIWSKTEEFVT